MNIVLDLDETLIHTFDEFSGYDIKPDFTFKLSGYVFKVSKRPHLKEFIDWIFNHPQIKTVNIWTAATRDYARNVVRNILTPEQREKLHVFHTRKQVVKGTKPLHKIFGNKLKKNNTIMIDDKAEIGINNPGNLIVIPAYFGDPKDNYLDYLSILIDLMINDKIKTNPEETTTYLKDLVDDHTL